MPNVTYPIGLDTDSKKLSAVYRLLEELRIEHNRVGIIARGDWGKHEGRWQAYKLQVRAKRNPLLIEMMRLKNLVRRANYTDDEWKAIDLSESDNDLLWGNKASLREIPTLATSPALGEVKAIDFLGLDGPVDDPLEDWDAAYTEVDPNSKLTVVANTITAADFARDSAFFVYKDFGDGHFDTTFSLSTDNEHLVSSEQSVHVGSGADYFFYGLANVINPDFGEDPIILIRWISATKPSITIDDGVTDETDNSANLSAARHYMTLTRGVGGTSCEIFSDANRTTLVDTIAVAQGDSSFRYMHSAFTKAGGGTSGSYGKTFDLDVKEAAAASRRRVGFGAGWGMRR
ncbi:MAG: hypothetical protein IIC84_05570 [Chloroflexi bacterium]|nr:hypothetical protein [Chloroflexota bacterium]